MGAGVASLGMFQKSGGPGGMPGPPFDPSSAYNGLSVDSAGKIVWGDDGDGLADLISNRFVNNRGFNFAIIDALSTFGMGFGSSAFTNGVPEVFNGYSADSDVNGFFNKNESNGAHAAALYGTYNDLSINFLFGVTGSGYTGGFTGLAAFPSNSAFIQTIDASSSSKLFIAAQGGIYFQGDQNMFVSDSKMLFDNNLTIADAYPITGSGARFNIQSATKQVQVQDTGGHDFFLVDSVAGLYRLGDVNAGKYFEYDFASNTFNFVGGPVSVQGAAGTVRASQFGTGGISLTDVTLFAGAENRIINQAGAKIYFDNNAHNVKLNINGVDGFTGTVSPVTSITVNGGIVTAVS